MFKHKINKKIDDLCQELQYMKIRTDNESPKQIVDDMIDIKQDIEKFEGNIEEFKEFIKSGITFMRE